MKRLLPARVYDHCRAHPPRVLLYPGENPTVIRAARMLQDAALARPVLLGGPFTIRDMAGKADIPSRGLTIENPNNPDLRRELSRQLSGNRRFMERSREEREYFLKEPLHGLWARLWSGEADVALAGIDFPMARFAKSLLPLWSPKTGYARLFSWYLMIPPGGGAPMLFSDCSLNIRPTAEQLSEQARHGARLYKALTGMMARVAFLSFATMGSARHEKVDKVARAVERTHRLYEEVYCDGPFQVDAALEKTVAEKKAPQARLKGKANVFIFPTLDSGNLAQKISEHLGAWFSIGPMITGAREALHYMAVSAGPEQMAQQALLAAWIKQNDNFTE